jgi:hypothetical protein
MTTKIIPNTELAETIRAAGAADALKFGARDGRLSSLR